METLETQEELASDFNLEETLDQQAVERISKDHGLLLRAIEGVDLTQYITFPEAFEIVNERIDADYLANLINFENSHLVAQALVTNPYAARALFEELKYWADNGQI